MTRITGAAILAAGTALLGLGAALSLAFVPPFGEVLLLLGYWTARTGWRVVAS